MLRGNLYHAGGWHLRIQPCVEFLLFTSPFYSVASSHLGRFSSRCVVTTLPWAFYAVHNSTQTAYEDFSLKGHCAARSLCELQIFLRTLRYSVLPFLASIVCFTPSVLCPL